jgi:2-oxo-4-hydroxy-4-carboxy-5-ureidoimidazoline decarboxylase
LISARGHRRIPYESFHIGYRTTQRASDELVQCVCLARSFSPYRVYARKVGARNAQAISKVCMAALGRVSAGIVEDVRIAVGSVAPVPLRLRETENVVRGKGVDATLVSLAKIAARREVSPIDDIRSSARYRAAVTGNLVAEFLHHLTLATDDSSGRTLARWNSLAPEAAALEILPCCGSHSWAQRMTARRPIHDEATLLKASDEVCRSLDETAWMEAFAHHPRIGQHSAPAIAPKQSATWSGEEQKTVSSAGEGIAAALAEGNRAYEQRFGRIFIVCASGKSAQDILDVLERRLNNDEHAEFQESVEQQRQITNMRLEKWLSL